MNKLNRKKYKKAIKAFRKKNQLAGLTHHWVYFHDENHRSVLMYVNYSVVRRLEQLNNDQDIWYRKYHTFDIGGYNVYLQLVGPCLCSNYWSLERHYIGSYLVNKDCFYKILEDDDVEKYNDLLLEEYKIHNKELIKHRNKKSED